MKKVKLFAITLSLAFSSISCARQETMQTHSSEFEREFSNLISTLAWHKNQHKNLLPRYKRAERQYALSSISREEYEAVKEEFERYANDIILLRQRAEEMRANLENSANI